MAQQPSKPVSKLAGIGAGWQRRAGELFQNAQSRTALALFANARAV